MIVIWYYIIMFCFMFSFISILKLYGNGNYWLNVLSMGFVNGIILTSIIFNPKLLNSYWEVMATKNMTDIIFDHFTVFMFILTIQYILSLIKGSKSNETYSYGTKEKKKSKKEVLLDEIDKFNMRKKENDKFIILPDKNDENWNEQSEIKLNYEDYVGMSYFNIIEDPIRLVRKCFRCKKKIEFSMNWFVNKLKSRGVDICKKENIKDYQSFIKNKEEWFDPNKNHYCFNCRSYFSKYEIEYIWKKQKENILDVVILK